MTVRVNGEEITSTEIHREAQYHPAASFENACYEATRALVVRALLLGEAKRLQLSDELLPEDNEVQEQALIAELMDREVDVPFVDEDACQALYKKTQDKFRGPDLFAPCHILFAAPEGDEEKRAGAKLRAQEVLEELKKRPGRFARLARTSSGCPSGATGGSLGQITRGETMPAFEKALEALQPGELYPKAVETEHGFHVIKLADRVPGAPLPFEAVRDRIMIYLRDQAWRKALQKYVLDVAKRSEIEDFVLDTAAPELPEPDQRGFRILQ